jgi:hypothetical protein
VDFIALYSKCPEGRAYSQRLSKFIYLLNDAFFIRQEQDEIFLNLTLNYAVIELPNKVTFVRRKY